MTRKEKINECIKNGFELFTLDFELTQKEINYITNKTLSDQQTD
jgi:hypothetical protein